MSMAAKKALDCLLYIPLLLSLAVHRICMTRRFRFHGILILELKDILMYKKAQQHSPTSGENLKINMAANFAGEDFKVNSQPSVMATSFANTS